MHMKNEMYYTEKPLNFYQTNDTAADLKYGIEQITGTQIDEKKGDNATENKKVKDLTRSFLQATSLKGISKISKEKTWRFRFMWILGTLVGFGIGLYFIVTLVVQYLEFKVVTNIESCTDCKPRFPDITVCNLNMVNWIEYLSSTSFEEFTSHVHDLEPELLGNGSYYKRLYSIAAYMNNVMDDSFWANFYATGGNNLFVHTCNW